MNIPIDNETLWGEPENVADAAAAGQDNKCPFKEIECPYWEQGCQAELCVYR